jgi:hypothetical protein
VGRLPWRTNCCSCLEGELPRQTNLLSCRDVATERLDEEKQTMIEDLGGPRVQRFHAKKLATVAENSSLGMLAMARWVLVVTVLVLGKEHIDVRTDGTRGVP